MFDSVPYSAPTYPWASSTGSGDKVAEVTGGGGGCVVTVQPESLALVAVAEPSLTSTVQSAGEVYGLRDTLKLPDPSLVAIATPSTVIDRLAVARPSIRSLPSPTSARDTDTAANAGVAENAS